MEAEITPEPSAGEREALEEALARLLAGGKPDPRGPWWQTGVEENVEDELHG
jgi:hypothetical protein